MLRSSHRLDPNNQHYMCNWCLRDCLQPRMRSADKMCIRLHLLLLHLLSVRVRVSMRHIPGDDPWKAIEKLPTIPHAGGGGAHVGKCRFQQIPLYYRPTLQKS